MTCPPEDIHPLFIEGLIRPYWCAGGIYKKDDLCPARGKSVNAQTQIDRIDQIVFRLQNKKSATFATTLSAWAHQSPR